MFEREGSIGGVFGGVFGGWDLGLRGMGSVLGWGSEGRLGGFVRLGGYFFCGRVGVLERERERERRCFGGWVGGKGFLIGVGRGVEGRGVGVCSED